MSISAVLKSPRPSKAPGTTTLGRLLIAARRKLPGWDSRNWLRIRQIESFTAFLKDHQGSDVLEISPGKGAPWKALCRTYTSVAYPDFDICEHVLPRQFGIVIADQVLEHVAKPADAVRNIHAMLRPGGHAMIATPFLFRVHPRPHDYYRWTEEGLRQLLTEGGFLSEAIRTASWGNEACARAHIGGAVKDYGFRRNLSNNPEYPLIVWAFASKPTV